MTLPDHVISWYIRFSMPRGGTAFSSATGPPATARPRHARHTWQHKVSSAKERAQCQTRRAGGVERSPPGDSVRGARERSGSPGREGVQRCRRGFPPVIFFVSPVWGFNSFFFRGWPIIIPPPGIFFSYHRVFGLSDRASDSVPTGQWFEPRLPPFAFFFACF